MSDESPQKESGKQPIKQPGKQPGKQQSRNPSNSSDSAPLSPIGNVKTSRTKNTNRSTTGPVPKTRGTYAKTSSTTKTGSGTGSKLRLSAKNKNDSTKRTRRVRFKTKRYPKVNIKTGSHTGKSQSDMSASLLYTSKTAKSSMRTSSSYKSANKSSSLVPYNGSKTHKTTSQAYRLDPTVSKERSKTVTPKANLPIGNLLEIMFAKGKQQQQTKRQQVDVNDDDDDEDDDDNNDVIVTGLTGRRTGTPPVNVRRRPYDYEQIRYQTNQKTTRLSAVEQAKYDAEQCNSIIGSIAKSETMVLEQFRKQIEQEQKVTTAFNGQLISAIRDTYQEVEHAMIDLANKVKQKQQQHSGLSNNGSSVGSHQSQSTSSPPGGTLAVPEANSNPSLNDGSN